MEYTIEEVKKHNTINDCWMIIDGNVLDVTKFINSHPGGIYVLLQFAGKEATSEFEKVVHSNKAYEKMLEYKIGTMKKNA